jgi:hypothetical protein
MAHGANKHCVVKPPKGTHHADSSLARWNTDPADYPDHAIASLKLAGGDKNRSHDAMVPMGSVAWGPFSDCKVRP